jgi:uncharacterized RDD family membrane protein YckC
MTTDALASVTRRAVGLAIDSFLVAVPVMLLALWMSRDGATTTVLFGLVVLQAALITAYQTILVARRGQTVGHRWCAIAVVRRLDGGPVDTAAALRRAVVPAAVALVPFIGAGLVAVVYLRAALHPLRQGVHDAVAATVVVRRGEGVSAAM